MIKKIVIFCLSIQLSVAQSLDLNQLTNLGFEKNQDLALALRRIDLQKSLVNTAFEMPKTKFDLQVGNIQTPFVTDYTLAVVQNTELPKVYKLRRAFNESLVKIGEAELDILKNEFRFGVANIYYQLFYFQELTDLLKNENLKLQEIEKVYRRRQEEGETDGVEVSNIHLKITENEMKITNFQILRNELEGKLKFMLNTHNLPNLSFKPAQFGVDNSILENSKLKQQGFQIENSHLATQNEMNKLLPSINLGVMNQSMLGSWRQFIGVAGVEIPIFNKAQKARVQASKITSHIQELELEKMKHQLENEVTVLGKGIEDTQKNIDLINDVLLRESEKIMQVTMKKYMAGQLDYYDWYLTYNQNVNYKLELLNLQKNKNLSITNIKYLTGNE